MTTDAEVAAAHETLRIAFECARHTPLAAAAFRVLRLNIAPAHVQRAARVICAAQGKPPSAQWAALIRAARVVMTPKPKDRRS